MGREQIALSQGSLLTTKNKIKNLDKDCCMLSLKNEKNSIINNIPIKLAYSKIAR